MKKMNQLIFFSKKFHSHLFYHLILNLCVGNLVDPAEFASAGTVVCSFFLVLFFIYFAFLFVFIFVYVSGSRNRPGIENFHTF